jgi:GNAT superfamily N-acetyltransferase
MAIVPLYLSRDRLALETHFAALDSEDLRYRFCGSIKPAGVIHYLDQLTAAHSYGIFNSSLALVAVCQLAQSAGDLEVGISVLTPFRRKGFAMALLDHSARYAQARGLKGLTIHSLADNTPMLSLARRIGMSVEILEGEADGRLRLRADTISGERSRPAYRCALRRSDSCTSRFCRRALKGSTGFKPGNNQPPSSILPWALGKRHAYAAAFFTQPLHHPVEATLFPGKIVQGPIASPALA